jgi:VCBS repeat-containing protein
VVTATDVGGLSDTQNVTVNVTNVNEAPVLGGDTTVSVAENQTAVGTFAATDPDAGDTVTYALSGPDAGLFSISASGVVTFTTAPDFETTPGPFTFVVTATDVGGLSDTQNVTVNVTNVNEAPVLGNVMVSVNENSPNGTPIYNVNDALTGVDQDRDGTALTYSITGGNVGGAFAINPATGAITVANSTALDFETTPSFILTVQASDGSLTGTAAVTINLNDLNETGTSPPPPPVLTVPPSLLPIPSSGPLPVSPAPGPMPSGSPIVLPTGNVSTPVLPPPVVMGSAVSQYGEGVETSGAFEEPVRRMAVSSDKLIRQEQPETAPQTPLPQWLEPLSMPVKKMLAVGRNLADSLNRMADGLDRAMEERQREAHLLGRVASFSGLALSAGFAVWILRGGSILASFLVSMPAWRRFDPLPVLGMGSGDRRKRTRQVHEDDTQEKKQFRGLNRVLKVSKDEPDNKKRKV